MAPIHADALTMAWNGTLGAPLYLRDKVAAQPLAGSTRPGGAPETHMVLRPPYGERFYGQVRRGDAVPHSGIGSAHKVANAVFHLRATQCFATRCHPCVATAEYALILEDDSVFVPGISPGTPARFPQLVAAAAAQAYATLGANKLHLGVGQNGNLTTVPGVQDDAAHHKPRMCGIRPDVISGHERTGARLLSCSFYYDSHGYVLHRSLAESIVAAQRTLIEHDGDGRMRCVDPWDSESKRTDLGRCASDPGLLFDFFHQCDRRAPRGEAVRRVQCVGASLGGANTPWSLKHDNSERYRSGKGAEMHGDEFMAVGRLVAAIRSAAGITSTARASTNRVAFGKVKGWKYRYLNVRDN